MITPIYPGRGEKSTYTPVVHYFVREWAKNDINVRVINVPSNFPWLFYQLIRPFRNIIASRDGHDVRTWKLKEEEFMLDGVRVFRYPLFKFFPHSRFNNKEIQKAVNKIISYCESNRFIPNIIVAHWPRPSLDIMHHLKSYYKVPTCYVMHGASESTYSDEIAAYINETDLIGYRSDAIRRVAERVYNCGDKHHFLCNSGLPARYIENINRFITSRNRLIFVGTLIARKYPSSLVYAANKAFGGEDFTLTYIGDGAEKKNIINEAERLGITDHIKFLGHVTREEVILQLDEHPIFVMISKKETFGLVYLEAMARGCITIASRNEGFDGIIEDGVNGFLCEAGNASELAEILIRIKLLPSKDLQTISECAIKTAQELTDEKVAKVYLNQLVSLL